MPPAAVVAPLGYFLGFSPLTSALKSAPARNLGTEELGTWMVAPVAGLRAVRAGRSLFSKTPKPVMATLSPLATADWMVSSTAFTASVADFLSPSRPEIASIRSRLFMVHSCASPTGRVGSETRSRPLTCPKVGDQTPLHNNLGHIGPRVGEFARLSIQQVYAKYPNSGCALPYAHARGQKRNRAHRDLIAGAMRNHDDVTSSWSGPLQSYIVVVSHRAAPGWDAPAGGSGGYGEEFGAGVLEGGDVVDVAKGQADVVQALHQPPAGVVVDLEGRADPGRLGGHQALVQVHDDLGGRFGLHRVLQGGHGGLGEHDREQAGLGGVAAEDVAEPGCDHGPEAVVGQRPDRVLARRAGAEVGARDQDRRPFVLRLVEHEGGVLAPGGEQALAEAGPAHLLEVLSRDDLVGVDVAAAQRHRAADVRDERFHD